MVRAYVLIGVKAGTPKRVTQEVRELVCEGVKVTSADSVTGEFDVIAQIEGELEAIITCVTEGLRSVDGVERTQTLLAVNLG